MSSYELFPEESPLTVFKLFILKWQYCHCYNDVTGHKLCTRFARPQDS